METCRHFRFQVPREVADELRDADPKPCPLCDALPHRHQRIKIPQPPRAVANRVTQNFADSNWFNRLLCALKLAKRDYCRPA